MKAERVEVIQKVLLWLAVLAFSVVWGLSAALAEGSLELVSISGAAAVNDGSSIQLKATAVIDGKTMDVTTSSRARWSLNSTSYASISRGKVTAKTVPNCAAQTVTVAIRYTRDGVTLTDTHDVAIIDDECPAPVPPAPTLSSISIGGPASVNESSTLDFPVTAAMSDGSTKPVSAVMTEDSPYAVFNGAQLTTTAVTGNQTVHIGASYAEGGITRTASKQVTITDVLPPPTQLEGSHAGRFTSYDGAATCLACHRTQAVQVYRSEHYQWSGKFGAINDFCIYPDINLIGKLTNTYGNPVDSGCLKCHPGLGSKPTKVANPTDADLANIDCLVCHAPKYKRTVDPKTQNRYVPDEGAMKMTILEAAVDIQPTSRDTCLNCHTKSGGGDNFKRGDIEEHHRNPATRAFDVHMSPSALGGGNMHCTECHSVSAHRISGRGADLRIEEGAKPDCITCHTATPPHGNSNINNYHVKRVHCTTCHIPTFAKFAPTDMFRDWGQTTDLLHELNLATGLYDPARRMESNVTPQYKFWDGGQPEFYNFGTSAVAQANGNVLMAGPADRSPVDAGAKIHPFKVHTATQPIDTATDRLLPLKMGIFYTTGDVAQAVAAGKSAMGWDPTVPWGYQSTERWMGLFHEVAPKEQALAYNSSCTTCHGGTTTRMDLKSMGYAAKKPTSDLCNDCHGSKSYSFTSVHPRHTNKGYDCSACHAFSRAR